MYTTTFTSKTMTEQQTLKNINIQTKTYWEHVLFVRTKVLQKIEEDLNSFIKDDPKKWSRNIASIYELLIKLHHEHYSKLKLFGFLEKNISGKYGKILHRVYFDCLYLIENNLHVDTVYTRSNEDIIKDIRNIRPEISKRSKRPIRNIPCVVYYGMDIEEPESQYDNITNIWNDFASKNDPDYDETTI